MKIHQYREMMRYLTRKPTPKAATQVASGKERVLYKEPFYQQPQQLIQDDIARPQVDNIPLYQGVQPGVAIEETMPTYVPPNMSPVTPSAPGVPDPQFRQIELATGGRVNFNEGSKLTGTDKTLEQNIKQDHKAYNDYRKSIGSPTVPLDNEYIRMWIRSRLNSGGPANKDQQKIIPLNLDSVAFKLFQDKLDNLSYNQKQTVYDYIEDNRNKKAEGGRIKLQNGTEEPYNPEIPSLGFSDPIDILEQQLINEKDSTRVNALSHLLENAKKERKAKEMAEEEFKKSQKEKGIKYKEDFPSEAAYFAETGKQLLTNPKYFLGKGAKGLVEGTEFLVGQPLQTLFSQEGKNFELYEPVGGEKLGINKFIEKNIPKGATTGTLVAGDVAEIAGSVADPFLAYGLAKGAIKGAKPKPPTTAVDETIDPTRRDILKTGAVMGAGAALYPTAKKLGMFDELAKGAKVAARTLPKVKGMPEWFSPFISRIEREGVDVISEAKKAQELQFKKIGPPPNVADHEIIQSKKLEIKIPGKEKPDVVTMTEYKNGNITVQSNTYGGAFDEPFDIFYTAPKEVMETKYVRDKDGNLVQSQFKVQKEGSISVEEQRPGFTYAGRYYDESPDVELDYTDVPFENSISDLERLEEIATGKKPDPKKIKDRKEYRDYVEKNPYEDALSRTPEPDPDYDYSSYIKDNE
jgi:hypothetical protein